MTSVLQPWVMDLPLRHQGTLLAAVRNCDNVPKQPYDSTSRQLVAYLRYTFLVPADPREIGYEGAFLQESHPTQWKASDIGHLSEHFYSHLMHAYEVVGYEHPEKEIRDYCRYVYRKLVENLHLSPESREAMNARLTEDRIMSGNVVS